ncbi:MAG: Holliday junction resolvase RuvX, partial [Polyangiaceae bacterium]|nr:Holliday junction resolvase RuvX [Polyangiaceae bacterium]
MRVAAVDLGKVRVGLAVTDELGLMAHPRPALDGRNRRALLARLVELVHDEQVELFVVGLPLDPSGRDGPAAREARAFAAQVEQATSVPVELWDERFTTVEAQRRLRDAGRNARSSRQRIDSAAACVLLQAWLD